MLMNDASTAVMLRADRALRCHRKKGFDTGTLCAGMAQFGPRNSIGHLHKRCIFCLQLHTHRLDLRCSHTVKIEA